MVMRAQDKKSRLAFADGLRAIASMWVVLYHLAEGQHIALLLAKLPDFLRVVMFEFGGLGVAIFFVLSGYVMAHTMRHAQVDFNAAVSFIIRRLVRLSPPYYVAIAVALCFIWLKARFSTAQVVFPDIASIVAHLFYATDFLGAPSVNSVFWTLGIEVQFYIVFALCVFIADSLTNKYQLRDARFYVTVCAAGLALPWAFQWITTPLWKGGFIGFWYSFVLGMMACWAADGCDNKFKRLSYVYILCIFISGLVTQQLFSITAAFTATLLCIAGQKDYMGSWLNWRFVQYVGLISYSLYLLHNPVTGAVANVIRRVLPNTPLTEGVIFVAAITACLVAAWVAYIVIELPSIRWSRKISR